MPRLPAAPGMHVKNLWMCLLLIALGIAANILLDQQLHAQTRGSSDMIIDVEKSSQTGVFSFSIGGQPVPGNDLLGFLRRGGDKKGQSTVPIVIIPPSLTVLEIGSIEATFSKAGYHRVRFFLYAKNSDFVEEIVFKEPVSAEIVRGKIPEKR